MTGKIVQIKKPSENVEEIFYSVFKKILSETVIELQLLEADVHEGDFAISQDPEDYSLHQRTFIYHFLQDMKRASGEAFNDNVKDNQAMGTFIKTFTGECNVEKNN